MAINFKEEVMMLLEADYSSAASIIDGIKNNKITIKGARKYTESPQFKFWLEKTLEKLKAENIQVSKVLNVIIKNQCGESGQGTIICNQLTPSDIDALKYYTKYKSSPNFKDLIKDFDDGKLNFSTFHNKIQEKAESTRNNQRALRKAQTNDEDIKTIYDKNGWTVRVPKTWQASVKAATFPFGKAKWCTASSSAELFFNRYTNKGKNPLFIVSGGTKETTFQAAFNEGGSCDLQNFDNDHSKVNFEAVPNEVLKACNHNGKSLYTFAMFSRKKPDSVKKIKDKDGWTHTIVYRYHPEENPDFGSYINGYEHYGSRSGYENWTKGDKTVEDLFGEIRLEHPDVDLPTYAELDNGRVELRYDEDNKNKVVLSCYDERSKYYNIINKNEDYFGLKFKDLKEFKEKMPELFYMYMRESLRKRNGKLKNRSRNRIEVIRADKNDEINGMDLPKKIKSRYAVKQLRYKQKTEIEERNKARKGYSNNKAVSERFPEVFKTKKIDLDDDFKLKILIYDYFKNSMDSDVSLDECSALIMPEKSDYSGKITFIIRLVKKDNEEQHCGRFYVNESTPKLFKYLMTHQYKDLAISYIRSGTNAKDILNNTNIKEDYYFGY